MGCDSAVECDEVNQYYADKNKASTPDAAVTTAETALDQATTTVTRAKEKRDDIKHQVIDMIGDLIGYNDARDCFTKGDVMACINTALGSVPWGKIFKAIKIGIKAFKIYKEIDKAYDAIREGERIAARAAEAVTRAKRAAEEAKAAEKAAAKAAEEKAAKETASDAASTESKSAKAADDAETKGAGKESESAPTKCNSFPTGTRVLMADGTTKALEDLHSGDKVMATDPQTGETRPEAITATITTPEDKDFTDLTLTNDANPRGPPAKITSTHHHPYWSETRHQWIDSRRTPGWRTPPPARRNLPHGRSSPQLPVRRHHPQPDRQPTPHVLCAGRVHAGPRAQLPRDGRRRRTCEAFAWAGPAEGRKCDRRSHGVRT